MTNLVVTPLTVPSRRSPRPLCNVTILNCRLLILETYRQCSTGLETGAEQVEQAEQGV